MSMAKSVTDLLTLKMKNIKMAMVLSIMLNRKDGWIEKRDIMKKFEEIVNEIKVLSDKMKDTENEIKAEKENHNKYFNELFEGLSFFEKVKNAKTHEEYKIKEEEHNLKISELENKLTFRKLKKKILENNARTALFNETFPTIIEVWNNYEGKKHGEKTSEKIRKEIREKTNCFIGLSGYCGNHVYIDYDFGTYFGKSSYYTEVYLKHEHKMLVNNVIQKVTMDDFHAVEKYIDDIDMHIHNMLIVYKEVQRKRKELETACAEFNLMTVDGIEYLYANKDSHSII